MRVPAASNVVPIRGAEPEPLDDVYVAMAAAQLDASGQLFEPPPQAPEPPKPKEA